MCDIGLWQFYALPKAGRQLVKARAHLEGVVREYCVWAPTLENGLVDQLVDRALSGELYGSDGEHISPTTETVGDEQAVGGASRRDRMRTEVVDSDGDARTLRQRHGCDWPSDSHSWGFPCFALQAVAKPPSGAYVHADTRVKSLQNVRRVRGTKVNIGRLLITLHDPSAHEKMDVDVKRLIV